VLIPIHSRIVGSYNSVISYGQGNVQESWQYIWFPDGTTLDLDKFPGLNADGSTGLRDKTDNHIKRLVGGVLLSAIFSAGVEIGQKGNAVGAYPSTGNLLGAGVSQAAGRAGDQITQRNLNVQPTLNIRPGKQFAVEVKKTLVFVNGPYLPFDFGK
jgi:type IV secretion system protein VirB10